MKLLIVGAGGMGREVFTVLSQEIKHKKNHKIIGFLDDDPNALARYNYPVKIICSISDYIPKSDEKLLLAIANPANKIKITTALLAKGASFYTLIHPTVINGINNIGNGCIIFPNCTISSYVDIGDFAFLNTSVRIGHDSNIGAYTVIHGDVDITGNVEIGEKCIIGTGAKIIPGIKIGSEVTVGIGSIIIKNIPNCCTVFGNPAKIIKRW